MIKLMFSVWDSKSGLYGQPYFAQREEVAVRHFAAALSDPESMLGKFPEDFTLFHIGHFNEESGTLTPCTPTSVVGGAVLKSALAKGGN